MPLSNGKGICVLTHTNVAIDEIKSKLNSQAEVLFNYPNYFGTIQGFVDKFLTIPYYNSVEENPLAIIDDERAKLLFLKAFSTKTFDDLKILWRQIQDRIPSGLEGKEKRSKIKEEQIRLLFNSFMMYIARSIIENTDHHRLLQVIRLRHFSNYSIILEESD